MTSSTLTSSKNWRTPTIVLICGGLALTIALGTRHSFGLFLPPMTMDLDWNRQTFAYAMALQNLVYGIAQPFTGMIADKYGAARVMVVGTILYALGLLWMANPASGTDFSLSAGVMIGLALSCSGFSIVFGVIGRAFPPEKRSTALGIAGAAGSLGQFVMLPFGQLLINQIGWHYALMTLALTVLVIAPLSAAMVEDRASQPASQNRQSIPEALREAARHRGYWLLCTAYTVCGFQVMFISIHFPAFMIDQHMAPEVGTAALALIGLFNVLGSYTWGWLGGRHTKKYLLSTLYLTRSLAIAIFIMTPISPWSVYIFGAVIGFLWLGTVPLTTGVIAQIFGVKYLSTLTGIAFLFHQIGSFLGIGLAGYLFDTTGSYTLMWILTIAMGVVAGILNYPIDDRQIERRPAGATT
jgi:nitrate/nitrite transporter NarK